MAKCRRCGTVFDYDTRDGVCPGCCFYNRPDGKASYDDEWLRSYNVEENTYVPPKVSWQEEEGRESSSLFGKRIRTRNKAGKVKYSRAADCHTEGSHVHRETGGQTKGGGKQEKPRKAKSSRIFLIIVLIYLTISFLPGLIGTFADLASRLIQAL